MTTIKNNMDNAIEKLKIAMSDKNRIENFENYLTYKNTIKNQLLTEQQKFYKELNEYRLKIK